MQHDPCAQGHAPTTWLRPRPKPNTPPGPRCCLPSPQSEGREPGEGSGETQAGGAAGKAPGGGAAAAAAAVGRTKDPLAELYSESEDSEEVRWGGGVVSGREDSEG